MKKILTVLLMLSLLVLLLSACAEEQMEINPQQIKEAFEELAQEEERELIAEVETVRTPELSPEPIQVVEGAETKETTDNPQDKIINTPTETLAPVPTPKPAQSQTSVITPKPIQSNESTQAQNQTSVPTPQSTPELVEQSTPTPQSTPQPTPEPIPEPNPQPTPPVIIVMPPPARTICNTCEAEITDNLVEHGTAHLINDENFSYRNE